MTDISDDLLLGASAIAREVLGNDTVKNRRKIYHLHQRRLLPTFKLGSEIAARRSAIRQRIADRERAALDDHSTA